ncbi:MAG: hypothetical protein JNK21_04045 [Rhodospirillaceae bacterium]|nr:hypothetical protein [Rhodospirillaceae bacterium]
MNLVELSNDISSLLKARKWLVLFAVALISPLMLALLAFVFEWDASYSVVAETQYLEVGDIEAVQPAWIVEAAEIEGADGVVAPFSGRVRFPPHSRLLVERIGEEPPAVTVLPPAGAEAETFVLLEPTEGAQTAKLRLPAFLSFNACTSASPQSVLPIAGSLVLGKEVGDQAEGRAPILRTGSVKVLGRELLSPNRFEAGAWALDAGDRLSFDYLPDRGQLGAGFLKLGCDPNIAVTYHAPARMAVVSRFGAAGYAIKPLLWSRLMSDSFYQRSFILYSTIAPLLVMGILAVFRVKRQSAAAKKPLARIDKSINRNRPRR